MVNERPSSTSVQNGDDSLCMPLLELEDLEHRLADPQRPEEFCLRVSCRLEIFPRQFVALLGPSGCGKTTLLTILGLLRCPSRDGRLGRFIIRVNEQGNQLEFDLRRLWDRRKLGRIEWIRRRYVGFALQSGELLSALTVAENISAPLQLNGWPSKQVLRRANELIAAFRLQRENDNLNSSKSDQFSLAKARINRLSGGEYQRVSLARSIAHHPQLLFVDEPTAALNRELAHVSLDQLRNLMFQGEQNVAAIMITHDEELAREYADLILRMAPMKTGNGGELVDVCQNTPKRHLTIQGE